jgi:PhzF family phenazine biosynthesis protein
MSSRIFKVDSFTETPFAGNPAGVCLLAHARDERFMQAIAREMNVSETAFLRREADGFRLRWFTPLVEVDLCGHATLASAHILWTEGVLPPDQVARFQTRSGLLTASLRGNLIELDFPARLEKASEPPAGLVEALGVTPRYLGRNVDDYLVLVDDEATVRALAPNFAVLKAVAARGVIVTARSATPDFDFVSRFFAPRVGVDEDPVTGSAHCCLGPFWQVRLGKNELRAYQASARGGTMAVRVEGERVKLGGRAVTILRGDLLV